MVGKARLDAKGDEVEMVKSSNWFAGGFADTGGKGVGRVAWDGGTLLVYSPFVVYP